MSGLAAARRLHESGVATTLFDKGRRVAGRMSTRRTRRGFAFDHGAQYFTVRDSRFESRVASWIEQGVAAEWQGRIGVLSGGRFVPSAEAKRRFVGVPGMDQLCAQMSQGLDVRLEAVVATATCTDHRWRLMDDQGGGLGEFDTVIVSTPAPQAVGLLGDSPRLRRLASKPRMSACWAVMLAFDKSLGLGFDGAFVEDSPLSWVARDSSKPGRSSTAETWVLHAAPGWSERCVDDDPGAVQAALIDAFWAAVVAPRRSADSAAIHRWRYALPPEPLGERYLLDQEKRLAACGDWCGGPRVEGAYLSGLELASRLLRDDDSGP